MRSFLALALTLTLGCPSNEPDREGTRRTRDDGMRGGMGMGMGPGHMGGMGAMGPGMRPGMGGGPTAMGGEQIPAPSDVAAPPADAERTDSGLASKVITPGTGSEHPDAHDRVQVHYTGWTTDGQMFDSSYRRGRPATFPLGGVIAGWTEGVQLMVEGEKRRFWIPEELAYGGRPGAPQGMLVFDIQLLEIQ